MHFFLCVYVHFFFFFTRFIPLRLYSLSMHSRRDCRGYCYHQLADAVSSLNHYNKAISLSPKTVNYYIMRVRAVCAYMFPCFDVNTGESASGGESAQRSSAVLSTGILLDHHLSSTLPLSLMLCTGSRDRPEEFCSQFEHRFAPLRLWAEGTRRNHLQERQVASSVCVCLCVVNIRILTAAAKCSPLKHTSPSVLSLSLAVVSGSVLLLIWLSGAS